MKQKIKIALVLLPLVLLLTSIMVNLLGLNIHFGESPGAFILIVIIYVLVFSLLLKISLSILSKINTGWVIKGLFFIIPILLLVFIPILRPIEKDDFNMEVGKLKMPFLCNTFFADKSRKARCYSEVARETMNEIICNNSFYESYGELADYNKNTCYYYVALEKRSAEICKNIDYKENQENCILDVENLILRKPHR